MIDSLRGRVESYTAGSPVQPGVLWTNQSPSALAAALDEDGFEISPNTVARLLRESLQLGRRQAEKTLALGEHPDRDAQFRRIAELKAEYFDLGWPVISIDTKKKELLGNFHRPGSAWTDGHVRTLDHDYPSAGFGKAIPYGVYDLAANEGFVMLATGADTGQLACDAIRRWWYRLGRRHYWHASGILVLADCGGSNGRRVPLFREQLCKLAHRLRRPIRVAHLPPYCSKYNPIDHRLFCHLSRSLRGIICRSLTAIRDALRETTTSTGLRVVVELARRVYVKGVKAAPDFLENEPIIRDDYLPDFNYTAPHI